MNNKNKFFVLPKTAQLGINATKGYRYMPSLLDAMQKSDAIAAISFALNQEFNMNEKNKILHEYLPTNSVLFIFCSNVITPNAAEIFGSFFDTHGKDTYEQVIWALYFDYLFINSCEVKYLEVFKRKLFFSMN